jgi:hypothetical protein
MPRMLTHTPKGTLKLIATVFWTILLQEVWNEKGFVHVNFFPRETTVKSNQYTETPRNLKADPC